MEFYYPTFTTDCGNCIGFGKVYQFVREEKRSIVVLRGAMPLLLTVLKLCFVEFCVMLLICFSYSQWHMGWVVFICLE